MCMDFPSSFQKEVESKYYVWSCHKTIKGICVCLRSKRWHTGIFRELDLGAAFFLIDNPSSFWLLIKELEYELKENCQGLVRAQIR